MESSNGGEKRIDNIVLGQIDYKDAPDFSDAFIESADIDGRPMTEEELDELNEDGDFVHQAVHDYLY